MKKIIKFIIILFSFMYFYPNTTLGFLNDSDSFDLYNNIDKWYEELESQFTVREISWWGENLSIAEVLNQNASVEKLNECFKSNINYFDVKNLATWDDSTSFNTKILNSCWKNWQISQSLLSKYQKIAISTYNKWLIKASTKVDNIYKISRIWLYSDWIKENSPFDLVTDIEEINDIVFEKELTYNWQQWYDLSQKVDDLLYWDNSSLDSSVENNNTNIIPDWNNQVCKTNDTNLSDDSKKLLLWETNNIPLNEDSQNYNKTENETYYSPVTDDDLWPCNNFFCITIEFVTHNQNLLWWLKSNSIEWLLKKYNDTFKKTASTSLIQSKMTTNNFELWLKDLNLPDMFHMWIQISSKPVPILNLNSKNSDENSDFSSKNLLDRYYSNLWLEYKRANDLSIFKQNDYELKNVLANQEQKISDISKKEQELNWHFEYLKKQNDYLSNNLIDQNVSLSDLDWFYKQFIEINNFVSSIYEYTINLEKTIKWMNEIKNW